MPDVFRDFLRRRRTASPCQPRTQPGSHARTTAHEPPSISYAPTWTREDNGWTIIEEALLREVSILKPSVRPAEPLAQVPTLSPVEQPNPKPPEVEMSFGHGQILRRPSGQVLAVGGRRTAAARRNRTEVTRTFTDGSVEITEFDAYGVARAWEIMS